MTRRTKERLTGGQLLLRAVAVAFGSVVMLVVLAALGGGSSTAEAAPLPSGIGDLRGGGGDSPGGSVLASITQPVDDVVAPILEPVTPHAAVAKGVPPVVHGNGVGPPVVPPAGNGVGPPVNHGNGVGPPVVPPAGNGVVPPAVGNIVDAVVPPVANTVVTPVDTITPVGTTPVDDAVVPIGDVVVPPVADVVAPVIEPITDSISGPAPPSAPVVPGVPGDASPVPGVPATPGATSALPVTPTPTAVPAIPTIELTGTDGAVSDVAVAAAEHVESAPATSTVTTSGAGPARTGWSSAEAAVVADAVWAMITDAVDPFERGTAPGLATSSPPARSMPVSFPLPPIDLDLPSLVSGVLSGAASSAPTPGATSSLLAVLTATVAAMFLMFRRVTAEVSWRSALVLSSTERPG